VDGLLASGNTQAPKACGNAHTNAKGGKGLDAKKLDWLSSTDNANNRLND